MFDYIGTQDITKDPDYQHVKNMSVTQLVRMYTRYNLQVVYYCLTSSFLLEFDPDLHSGSDPSRPVDTSPEPTQIYDFVRDVLEFICYAEYEFRSTHRESCPVYTFKPDVFIECINWLVCNANQKQIEEILGYGYEFRDHRQNLVDIAWNYPNTYLVKAVAELLGVWSSHDAFETMKSHILNIMLMFNKIPNTDCDECNTCSSYTINVIYSETNRITTVYSIFPNLVTSKNLYFFFLNTLDYIDTVYPEHLFQYVNKYWDVLEEYSNCGFIVGRCIHNVDSIFEMLTNVLIEDLTHLVFEYM